MEPVFGQEDRVVAVTQLAADYKNIIMFIESLKLRLGYCDDNIECGYEAGCLGYSLYNQLMSAGIKCTILAPTTMLTENAVCVKTDARDARKIAQYLAYGGYNAVYVPTEEDDPVKEYLRMRDDHQIALKKIKQQINSFCLRHGYNFGPNKWTGKHIAWLKTLKLAPLYQETLDEYMASYYEMSAKVASNVAGLQMNFSQRLLGVSQTLLNSTCGAVLHVFTACLLCRDKMMYGSKNSNNINQI